MSVNIYTAAGLKKVAGSGFMDAELNANSNNGVKNKVINEAIKQINEELSDFDVRGTNIPVGTSISEFCTMVAQKLYPALKWIYNNASVEGVNFSGSGGWGNAGTYLYINGGSGSCYTAVPIDLTNYSTVHFRGSCGVSENAGGGYSFGVAKAAGGTWAKYAHHSTTNYQTISIADDIDISELEGEYYVQFDGASARAGYGCGATVTQIWLD